MFIQQCYVVVAKRSIHPTASEQVMGSAPHRNTIFQLSTPYTVERIYNHSNILLIYYSVLVSLDGLLFIVILLINIIMSIMATS